MGQNTSVEESSRIGMPETTRWAAPVVCIDRLPDSTGRSAGHYLEFEPRDKVRTLAQPRCRHNSPLIEGSKIQGQHG